MQDCKGDSVFRSIAALLEDPGLVLSTQGGSQLPNSSPRGSDVLLWPPLAAGMHAIYIHRFRQTHRKIHLKEILA